MTVWRLATREILHRRAHFGCAVAAVAVAVGAIVAGHTLLEVHGQGTRAVLAAKERELSDRVATMGQDVERAMAHLGFNIVILPKDQNLADWYAEDYAVRTMPEAYVKQLRDAGLVTIEHLVPRLRQRVKWAEKKWTIILVGVGSGLEDAHPTFRESFVHSVPPGKMVAGDEIARGVGLKEGKTVSLLGRQLEVERCLPQRGTKEDVTVWLNLKDAQELLGKPGRINEIVALECRCAWADLAKVRAEMARVLPDTQVIEKASQALGAARALTEVETKGQDAIEAERVSREELGRRRAQLWFSIGALAAVVCACWLGLLVRSNVRRRRKEVGVLRTLGFSAGRIGLLFGLRSLVLSLLGGAAGYAIGRVIGLALGQRLDTVAVHVPAFDPGGIVIALVWACAVTGVAAAGPTLLAAARDPATVLREDV